MRINNKINRIFEYDNQEIKQEIKQKMTYKLFSMLLIIEENLNIKTDII